MFSRFCIILEHGRWTDTARWLRCAQHRMAHSCCYVIGVQQYISVA